MHNIISNLCQHIPCLTEQAEPWKKKNKYLNYRREVVIYTALL